MRVRRASRLAGGLATAATAVGVIALLSGGGGCELAVGTGVPSFTCMPDAADVCPSGEVCVPATHECVPRSGTCTPGAANACGGGMRCDAQTLRCVQAPRPDASQNADAPSSLQPDSPSESSNVVGDAPQADGPAGDVPEINVPEVMPDVQTCSGDIGCGCKGSNDCTTGVCAQELTLTTALYMVVGNMNVCTTPCCTSTDCPSGTVCFGTGGGGNYCVPPKWISRNGGVGAAKGGAACSGAADCRSGQCNMGTCADTCCSTAQQAAECASGTFCRFAQFPGNGFDTHVTAWCGPAIGTIANGTTCGSDLVCQSGKCNVLTCQGVCRNSSECGTGMACSYGLAPTLPTNKDIIQGCMRSMGSTQNGGNCTSNSDCLSAFCDTGMHYCRDACATDADCKTGMRCQPVQVSVQGNYSVLACQ